MSKSGVIETDSKGQEKVICIADFLSNYLLTLSHNDDLNQEEIQLKKFENFIDVM